MSSRERLPSVCNDLVDNAPNGVSGIVVVHFPDFMKKMVWLKKAA